MSERVVIDGENLKPSDVERVAREGIPVEISENALDKVREGRKRLEYLLEADQPIYGVDTGFGSLVNKRISKDEVNEIQENLVRSHSAGADEELDRDEVRAMMVCRLNALVGGYSGIRLRVVKLLRDMINADITPLVKSRGSLGASGDLVPLAHMSLVMIGEGKALYNGDMIDGKEALEREGLKPLDLKAKEGIALLNGTALTTGISCLAAVDAERVVKVADIAGAFTLEATKGSPMAFDPKIQEVRPHPGQKRVASNVLKLIEDSEVMEEHKDCDRVQDAYSLRCIPQVHGAVREAVLHLKESVEIELNSTTDNPIIFRAEDVGDRAPGTDKASAVSGGNFHGEVLGLKLDYLTGAITELAAISERRVDRLLNPNIQEDYLEPFLTRSSGLNSGYMISQYTAVSLINENRSMGRPTIDNTPVSGGQEDHVSMSAESAYKTLKAVSNSIIVLAIELMCDAQAYEFIEDFDLGKGTGKAYKEVRSIIDSLEKDRVLYEDMEEMRDLVRTGEIIESVEEAISGRLE